MILKWWIIYDCEKEKKITTHFAIIDMAVERLNKVTAAANGKNSP